MILKSKILLLENRMINTIFLFFLSQINLNEEYLDSYQKTVKTLNELLRENKLSQVNLTLKLNFSTIEIS